ncbi:MAG: hypothetical protein ACYCOU_18445 [Sulfobacillus sp.]
MTKRKARRPLLGSIGLTHRSSAYRPIGLSGEIKAASSGIQVIDGNDFDKRAAALQKGRNKTTVHA